MIEALVDKLEAEFDDVNLYVSPPKTFNAPAVIVTPDTDFLRNGTHGRIEERWSIIAVTQSNQTGPAVNQLRDLCLRVREAVGSVGARWDGADTMIATGSDASPQVQIINHVVFRHEGSINP